VSQILRKLIKNHLSEFDQPISFSPEEITRDDAFPLN
jgi:hypothetical protein